MKNKLNLKEIYNQYDKKIIEANKKLPKPCYGNSNGYYCIYKCKSNDGCYEVTMKKWGTCNCKFKSSCHLSRQLIQSELKSDNPNHVCGFKKYFNESNYTEVEIPNGIIGIDPIED